MRVGQRLFLAVIPAILGVFTVLSLVYWGRYQERAPELLVGVAVVAAVLSLVMAWTNTRYVATRIERLADLSAAQKKSSKVVVAASAIAGAVRGREARPTSTDEIEQIERVVDHLSSAVATAEADRSRTREEIERQRSERAALMADVTSSTIRLMEEARLPIHILLDNHFGDLNENQEEMLGTARNAVDAADVALRQLRDLVDLELGRVELRHDRVKLNDVIQSVLPLVEADAERVGAHVTVELAPGLPALRADRARLQMAISSILRAHARRAPTGSNVQLTTDTASAGVAITLAPAADVPRDTEIALAEQLVAAHGGSSIVRDGKLVITLPAITPSAPSPG